MLTSDQTGRLSLLTSQLDYVHPLAHRRLLSRGGKASRVQSSNDAVFRQTTNGVTALDTAQTNRFRYTENIRAACLSWQANLSAGYLAGGPARRADYRAGRAGSG
jgi:hypothetical protein